MPPPRSVLPVLAGLLLLTSSLPAQIGRDKIYSRPEIPSKEALARLNLRLGWRAYVPTDGQKDALVKIELDGKDLIALTRSGIVQLMDAETGKVHWRTTVGKAYTLLPGVGTNNRSVYVIANAKLVALDRATGRKKWEYDLPAGISAAPVVDDEQIFIPTSTTRLYAFQLPFITDESVEVLGEINRRSTIYGGDTTARGPRPRPSWSDLTNIQLSFKPLQTGDTLFVISPQGQALAFSKYPREGGASIELYSFNVGGKSTVTRGSTADSGNTTSGKIRVPPGSYGNMAYIGSEDATLYAVNMITGKLRWRHIAGTPITRSPVTTAKDVYVTSDREGLARIDRQSGEAMWRIPSGRSIANANPQADRFLAANDRFVYAADSSGRLLVLDHKRGVRLSTLDTRAYRVQVVNEVTDRLYLAANDGLILCLHDRDAIDPIRHQKELEETNSPVEKILDKKINEQGAKETTLREALDSLRRSYKIKIIVADLAFRTAKLDDPSDKKVILPRSDDKTLRNHLERLLKQLNVTFEVKDQVIRIIPGIPEKAKD